MSTSTIQAIVPAMADNSLWSDSPTTNIGAAPVVNVQAGGTGVARRGVFAFDLTPYAGRRVAKATLCLVAVGEIYPSITYRILLMMEMWTEYGSSWANKDTGTPWQGPAGGGMADRDYVQVFTRPVDNGPFDVVGRTDTDLCGMVNSRLGSRLDLLMRREDEGGDADPITIFSRQAPGEENHPYLLLQFAGYEVLLKAGSPPIVGEDAPVATVNPGVATVDLQESALGLVPNTVYHAAIAPFNASGYAPTADRFTFRTDADGHPYMVPSPVHHLTVEPGAGGKAMVRWQYDELVSWATADSFTIAFEPLAGQSNMLAVERPHTEPAARSFAQEIAFDADGPWRVRVLARRDGKAETDVSGVAVMIDSEPPPAVTLPGMTAV